VRKWDFIFFVVFSSATKQLGEETQQAESNQLAHTKAREDWKEREAMTRIYSTPH